MSDWTISTANTPAMLVESTHLFDKTVTEEGARDFLSRPGHVLLLAQTSDGFGIGYITGVEMRHPDKPPEIFVYELAVDAAWRRRGVAKELVKAMSAEALRRGCKDMWTATEKDNLAAIATYRSAGASIDHESVLVTIEG